MLIFQPIHNAEKQKLDKLILMLCIKRGPLIFLVRKLQFIDDLIKNPLINPLGYIHFITVISGLCSKAQS